MIKVQNILALLDHLIRGSLQLYLTINTCIAKNSAAEKLREKKGSALGQTGVTCSPEVFN